MSLRVEQIDNSTILFTDLITYHKITISFNTEEETPTDEDVTRFLINCSLAGMYLANIKPLNFLSLVISLMGGVNITHTEGLHTEEEVMGSNLELEGEDMEGYPIQCKCGGIVHKYADVGEWCSNCDDPEGGAG